LVEASGCSEFADEVTRYAWGELSEERRDEVEAHLQKCPPCKELATFTEDLIRAVREDPKRSAPIAEPCPDVSLIVDLEAEALNEETARHVTAHLLYCKKCRDAYLQVRALSAERFEERALQDADALEVSRRQAENVSRAAFYTLTVEPGQLRISLGEVLAATQGQRQWGELAMTEWYRKSSSKKVDEIGRGGPGGRALKSLLALVLDELGIIYRNPEVALRVAEETLREIPVITMPQESVRAELSNGFEVKFLREQAVMTIVTVGRERTVQRPMYVFVVGPREELAIKWRTNDNGLSEIHISPSLFPAGEYLVAAIHATPQPQVAEPAPEIQKEGAERQTTGQTTTSAKGQE
jgi:hypothetical protein